MTGGSCRTHCDDCEAEVRVSARYCPDCGARQDWFTDDEVPDSNLEVVDRVDDVCSELEALCDEVDNPDVQAALRSAIGNVWRASVLQRVDKNSVIRMVAGTGRGSTSVRGPVIDVYTRERGESR
ncbi:hypothetical protein [Natrinema soli]|uniref:Zinc ribbon domain-containing protein n=1 Tax=Natrinema soli TaxID=1930624 RepID=A0ABD5SLY9_9EURY|nr:hypothetical protein [Natrinema soli]